MTIRSRARQVGNALGLAPVYPTILMYHRVADLAIDPWGLAVKPQSFAEQMRTLHRSRTVLPLTEFVDFARTEKLPRNAVAVTFDDGYVDNLVTAKPILEHYQISATLFLATGALGQQIEYWWDELAKFFLAESGPSTGSLAISGATFEWELPDWRGIARADVRSEGYRTRHASYVRVWSALRQLPAAEINQAMTELRRLFGAVPRDPLDRTMSELEVRRWLQGGLTTIAPHTVTHPAMTSLNATILRSEIAESVARCTELAGAPATGFAYPYGDLNVDVSQALREAGIAWACSTKANGLPRSGPVDLYDLPRIQVRTGNLRGQWRGAA